jgi:serine/threonine protein kinase/Tfp pilus assembly protein PilF
VVTDRSRDDAGQEFALPRGAALGRYLIVEPVGAGAMGVVYAAYDPQLDRKIALKIVREEPSPEEPASEGRARLLREARAMARLAHPNVVGAFDAGVLDEHVFIAMEFVEGQTLRRWLAEGKRSAREVLDVFIQAGRGLSAAHQAGLVHRDFKPDNVLVDARGRARVTDFGLARPVPPPGPTPPEPLAASDGGPGAAHRERRGAPDGGPPGQGHAPQGADAQAWPNLTGTGAVIGTPAYMAPEQIARRGADHRSDQFSFCAALFEALHGVLPFEGESAAAVAFAVSMGRLRPVPREPQVPAWIAPILRRGLALRPEDRHASMDALLAELSRDRARARRRWLVTASVILAATAGATGYAALAARVRGSAGEVCQGASRKLAGVWDTERRRATEAAFLATGLPYAADAARGVAAALDRYAAGWQAMRTDACQATWVRGEQPQSVLSLRTRCLERRLDEVAKLTDLFARADAKVVERAVAAAQSVRSVDECADVETLALMVEPPADPKKREAVEAVRRKIAEARALSDLGRYEKGIELATAAAASAGALEYAPVLAEALNVKGKLEGQAMHQQAAERTLHDAIVAAEAGRDEEERARAWTRLVWEVGNVQGRHEEGLRHARIADAIAGHLGRGQDELRAELQSHRGAIFIDQGRYLEAIAENRRALETRRRILAPDHRSVAISLTNLAIALDGAGRHEESFDHFRQALSILERVYGSRHPDVGTALLNIGLAYSQMGQFREAHTACERALSIHEAVFGATNAGIVEALDNSSEALRQLGLFAEAARHARRAVDIREKAGSDNPNLIRALNSLGWALREGGDVAAAEARFRRALDLAEKLGKDHPLVEESLSGLAACAQDRGDPSEALRLHRRALAIGKTAHGPDSLEVAIDLAGVGRALVASRRWTEAIAPLERALAIRKAHPVDPALRGEAAFLLAQARWETGRDREGALRLAEAARADYSASEGYRRREAAGVEAWVGSRAKADPDRSRNPGGGR